MPKITIEDVQRTGENQLARAAHTNLDRFLRSRKEKNRAEYLTLANRAVQDLVKLHTQHNPPPAIVGGPLPTLPRGEFKL